MKRTIFIALVTATMLVCAEGPARSATPFGSFEDLSDSRFGLSIGRINGMTLFHISSYDLSGSGVESELEFPLDTILFGIEGSYRNTGKRETGGYLFRYALLTNLDGGRGKMKDSDWLTDDLDVSLVGSPHPGLDIYSESDIDLNALIIDLRLSFDASSEEEWDMGPLLGLLFEKFSYDASNVVQVGYGPYAAGYSGSVSGLVLTYDVTYIVPFLGMHAAFHSPPSVRVLLDLGYSPWAMAEDRDDHVLRSKLSEASATGNAFLSTLAAQWEIGNRSSIELRGEYLRIDTKGSQNQTFYDGSGISFSGINDRIESEQFSVSAVFAVRL